jgi:membrane-bound metal-dependent hydrolase YbcI (DUF457 family)
MLARSHAVSGLLAGVGIVAVVPSAPWPVKVLAVGLTGGSALLPDLDTKSSTVAKSLWIVTGGLSRLLVLLSVAVYQATRSDGDPVSHGGHRTFTHTVPACLLAGGLLGSISAVSSVSSTVVAGLLFGLLGLGLRTAGFTLAAAGAALAWWTGDTYPGWSPLVYTAIAAGCFVHVLGDVVTVSGVPILWPLRRGDKRWDFVSTPGAFTTGTPVETAVLVFVLCPALALSTAWVTGVGPALHAAVSSVAAR